MKDEWSKTIMPTSVDENVIAHPTAPIDPIARHSGFYIMYENMIEGTCKPDGKFSHEIYLDGRLVDKAKYTGGVVDENILTLLQDCEGIRRLVHSIGITVRATSDNVSHVQFVYQNLGKTNKYESGTVIELACPANGAETLLLMDEVDWSSDDDVPGSFSFIFDQVGQLASVSLMFYLNEGFVVPEIMVEPPVDVESSAYQEMIKKSLLNKGNQYRLKRAIDKAKRGEKVTIAYIGGSITQGAGAVPIHETCYANLAYEQFKHKCGSHDGKFVELIKAGVGGTPSELGIVRYDRDVLRDGSVSPDIVVIEFAVNDAGDETKGNCYESLVLKALNQPNKPAVILLFSVFVDDWNLQDRLAPVGWHYDLPMVSVKDAVVDQFKRSKAEGNVISKRQFFYDIYHPTNDGHQVMADCLSSLFNVANESHGDEQDIEISKTPVIGNDFAYMKLLDRSNATSSQASSNPKAIINLDMGSFTEIDTDLQMVEMDRDHYRTPQFPNNWMFSGGGAQARSEERQSEFKMTIRSKNLILVFKDSGLQSFGCANVYVDGQFVKRLDPHENNWTHCNPVLLYNEQDVREHTIVISMAEGDEHKHFTILGFGYC